MLVKKVFFLCFLFWLVTNSAIAQKKLTTVTGTVTNANTGKPITGVNVYFSQTSLGAATDSTGKFNIQNIPEGTYNLVFSYVGFKTKVKSLTFLKAESPNISISLKPENLELEDVVVTANNKEWENNLALFKEEFLGTSEFARHTKIENPEILNFKWEKQKSILYATAPKELHIINKALGYQLDIVLKKFVYKRSTNFYSQNNETTYYEIYPRYRELEPQNGLEKIQWIRNRKEAYLGSKKHFFTALYNGDISREDFDIDRGSIKKVDQREEKNLLRYKPYNQSYKNKIKAFRYSIHSNQFDKPLAIQWQRNKGSFFFRTNKEIFFIDEFGNLLNPQSLLIGGVWYANRLADALPLNYTLPN